MLRTFLMLMLMAIFPSKSEPQATTGMSAVSVAISLVCAPEDSCSSAKVLVTDAGVGPGT